MSRQEDFDTQSNKYVEMRKSFGVNDPYALKEIGEAHYQGAEYGYQYAQTHPNWISVLLIRQWCTALLVVHAYNLYHTASTPNYWRKEANNEIIYRHKAKHETGRNVAS